MHVGHADVHPHVPKRDRKRDRLGHALYRTSGIVRRSEGVSALTHSWRRCVRADTFVAEMPVRKVDAWGDLRAMLMEEGRALKGGDAPPSVSSGTRKYLLAQWRRDRTRALAHRLTPLELSVFAKPTTLDKAAKFIDRTHYGLVLAVTNEEAAGTICSPGRGPVWFLTETGRRLVARNAHDALLATRLTQALPETPTPLPAEEPRSLP